MSAYDVRKMAREFLKGKFGDAALITFLYMLVSFGFSFVVYLFSLPNIISTILVLPLSYGYIISIMKLTRNENVGPFDFFTNGFTNFGRALGVQWFIFVKMLLPYILSVVSLIALIFMAFCSYYFILESTFSVVSCFFYIFCFIFVVGFIGLLIWSACKSLLYVLAIFIAYDNPNISTKEAVQRSEDLMKGNRGDYFILYLSFIGWSILSLFTLFIGLIWLRPYIQVSLICFYESLLKGKNVNLQSNLEDKKIDSLNE